MFDGEVEGLEGVLCLDASGNICSSAYRVVMDRVWLCAFLEGCGRLYHSLREDERAGDSAFINGSPHCDRKSCSLAGRPRLPVEVHVLMR